MKQLFHHIIYATLGIVLVLLTVANAGAQIVVEECDTMEFSVVSRPNIPEAHFVWAIYDSSPNPTDVLDPAGAKDPVPLFVDGMYASGEGSTVKVVGLGVGVYYVRIHVWDDVNCTDNIEMYVLEVIESTFDMELYGDSVCIGEPALVRIIFSGTGPYTIKYTIGDELTPTTINLNGDVVDPEITIPILDPLPVGETTFWIMEVSDDCKVQTYEQDERPRTGILIYPKPSNSKIYLKE